jgi:hypothetical protein
LFLASQRGGVIGGETRITVQSYTVMLLCYYLSIDHMAIWIC